MALKSLFKDFGVPHTLIPDNAKELTMGEFKSTADKAQCAIRPIEAYTPNQNLAETAIREIKRAYRRHMIATKTPGPLWDYCLQYVSELRSHTALPMHVLHGDTPTTLLTGDSPDISHLCTFSWYSYVWFLSPPQLGDNFENKFLGRYLGPSHDVGEALCSYVINSKARVASRTSVIPISRAERESEGMQRAIAEFEAELKARIEGPTRDPEEDEHSVPVHKRIEDEDDHFETYEDDEAKVDLDEDDALDHDAFDRYISARVCIPKGDAIEYGTVRKRKRDDRGNLIGRTNANPILDTSVYEVEFDDGRTEAFSANIIAESIYAQIDDEGHDKLLLEEIVEHRKTAEAVSTDDAEVIVRGQARPRRTTKGWKLLVQWKNGSTSWERLKDLKESDPVMVADYAVANKLVSEPAFSWWVPYTLRKRDRIIKAANKRYFRRFYKYGIELPKTVERALEIDAETGTDFWSRAIKNVKEWLEARGLALKTKAPGVLPSGYKPELDVTPYCDDDDMNYYQQQIGVLRWSVELGRIDICTEVSMMASYCAAPRRGHLGALMHVFAYLNTHQRSRIVFDDSYPPIPPEPRPDWSDFYPDAKEELPPDMPEPRGKPVELVVFVDADHAGDTVTRRSRTGVLIYMNRAPIMWTSKKQTSIETSTFGSEFCALKMAVEQVIGLRYKLRMMGVPLEGHAHVRVDNMSVVRNTSAPESQLKKKSNSIAYHFVREAAAADIVRIAYEPTDTNLADILTKTQPGTVRKRKVEMILY